MEKIDFVILWVDGDNKEWSGIRNQYLPREYDKKDSLSAARFRDMGTLKYVLRSIEKNCPWYNRIHLVTKGYYPTWLDINHPKISLVNEESIFKNTSCLPVFNSIAIEMNLCNIPNLSEQFIYLNDDMVIMQALKSERFFIGDKVVDFLVNSPIPRNRFFDFFKKRDTWIHSINNSLKLINRHFTPITLPNRYLYHHSYSILDKFNNFLLDKIFKKFIWIEHWHHPQPYLKKTLIETYNAFTEEMDRCSCNRFRSKSDLNPYIYRYYHLANADFYPYKHNDALVTNLDSIEILQRMIATLEKNSKINFVCFNDSVNLSDHEYEKVKKMLLSFLEEQFPNKASFEH